MPYSYSLTSNKQNVILLLAGSNVEKDELFRRVKAHPDQVVFLQADNVVYTPHAYVVLPSGWSCSNMPEELLMDSAQLLMKLSDKNKLGGSITYCSVSNIYQKEVRKKGAVNFHEAAKAHQFTVSERNNIATERLETSKSAVTFHDIEELLLENSLTNHDDVPATKHDLALLRKTLSKDLNDGLAKVSQMFSSLSSTLGQISGQIGVLNEHRARSGDSIQKTMGPHSTEAAEISCVSDMIDFVARAGVLPRDRSRMELENELLNYILNKNIAQQLLNYLIRFEISEDESCEAFALAENLSIGVQSIDVSPDVAQNILSKLPNNSVVREVGTLILHIFFLSGSRSDDDLRETLRANGELFMILFLFCSDKSYKRKCLEVDIRGSIKLVNISASKAQRDFGRSDQTTVRSSSVDSITEQSDEVDSDSTMVLTKTAKKKEAKENKLHSSCVDHMEALITVGEVKTSMAGYQKGVHQLQVITRAIQQALDIFGVASQFRRIGYLLVCGDCTPTSSIDRDMELHLCKV